MNKEQIAFEKWAVDNGFDVSLGKLGWKGQYLWANTRYAWEAWQARAALDNELVATIERLERKKDDYPNVLADTFNKLTYMTEQAIKLRDTLETSKKDSFEIVKEIDEFIKKAMAGPYTDCIDIKNLLTKIRNYLTKTLE